MVDHPLLGSFVAHHPRFQVIPHYQYKEVAAAVSYWGFVDHLEALQTPPLDPSILLEKLPQWRFIRFLAR